MDRTNHWSNLPDPSSSVNDWVASREHGGHTSKSYKSE